MNNKNNNKYIMVIKIGNNNSSSSNDTGSAAGGWARSLLSARSGRGLHKHFAVSAASVAVIVAAVAATAVAAVAAVGQPSLHGLETAETGERVALETVGVHLGPALHRVELVETAGERIAVEPVGVHLGPALGGRGPLPLSDGAVRSGQATQQVGHGRRRPRRGSANRKHRRVIGLGLIIKRKPDAVYTPCVQCFRFAHITIVYCITVRNSNSALFECLPSGDFLF